MDRQPTAPIALGYHRPTPSGVPVRRVLLVAGVLPFAIELVAIAIEAATGDPPNNLGEFKAYHYWTLTAALLSIVWFVVICSVYRGRNWTVIVVSAGWVFWVCWIGFWFLKFLNQHPAGAFYRSIW